MHATEMIKNTNVVLALKWPRPFDIESQAQKMRPLLQNYRRLVLLGECQTGCYKDSACTKGLVCTAKHKFQLRKLNVDQERAYCETTTTTAGNVCYNPKKLPYKLLLKECQTGCMSDEHCMKGLECTSKHNYKLQERNLDVKSAYCRTNAREGTCYDPKRLPPIVTDPQCPNDMEKGCNSTQASSCVSGKQYCCRQFTKSLRKGNTLCSELQCVHIQFCTCSSTTNEWECAVYDLLPSCFEPYKCSN